MKRKSRPYPQRVLRTVTLIDTVGTGLYLSVGVIFLTRSAGLSPTEVGIGLTFAGIIGMLAGIPIGDLADRRGAREVAAVSLVVEGLAAAALVAVDDVWTLIPVATFAAIGTAGGGSARGALVALVTESGEAAKFRSYLRAVANIGLALGTLGAAAILAIDTREAYVAMLLANASSFFVAAALIMRLSHFPPTRTGPSTVDDRRFLALRDRTYVSLAIGAAVAGLQYDVLIIAMPLWISLHTEAPAWAPAVLFLVAALLVAALQVPATRSINGSRTAARLVALSGPVFLAAWILMALAAGTPAEVALLLAVIGVALHSLGEVWQAAGTFELSFALARPEAQGQYQGLFGLAGGAVQAVAPIVLVALCISWGQPGWLVLGAVVTLAGVACAVIERRAAREPRGAVTGGSEVSA